MPPPPDSPMPAGSGTPFDWLGAQRRSMEEETMDDIRGMLLPVPPIGAERIRAAVQVARSVLDKKAA